MRKNFRKDTRLRRCYRWMMIGVMFAVPMLVQAQTIIVDERTRERARAFETLLLTIARQQGVDARVLWVIAYLESRFRPQAISPKGARGLMQLMPATAAHWGVRNLHEPRQSITGAARYVQYLGQRFDGRLDLTLAAYNAGEAVVDAYRAGRSVRVGSKLINPAGIRTGGVPPYRETRAYVRQGMDFLQQLTPARVAGQSTPTDTKEVVSSNQKSILYTSQMIPAAPAPPLPTVSRSISFVSR